MRILGHMKNGRALLLSRIALSAWFALNCRSSNDRDANQGQCPTSNDAFTPGCEPSVPACVSGAASMPAESYRGTFGSLQPDGSCQSDWPVPYLADCTEPLPEGEKPVVLPGWRMKRDSGSSQ